MRPHRLILAAIAWLALLAFAACAPVQRVPAPAQVLPELRLSPESLGRPLALQQRLEIRHGDHAEALDALLEATPQDVQLLVMAMGRTGVRLRWDGRVLEQRRAEWLPAAVRGERVLDDVQFAFWPAAAIRERLPAGWTLAEDAGRRVLSHADREWLVLERVEGERRMRLHNLAEGYALEISSMPLDEAP